MISFIYIIFFISGISCLISEVAWNRLLVLFIGNTATATSLVVMVFMAGLGIGSYSAGYFLRNKQATILPFILCQITIGLFILFSPFFFNGLNHSFLMLLPFINEFGLLNITRLSIVISYLIIPTFFMGATFPAIIHAISFEPSNQQAKHTGYLYGINALGASLGCFIAGYTLLPHLGIQSTLIGAALLNFIPVFWVLRHIDLFKSRTIGSNKKPASRHNPLIDEPSPRTNPQHYYIPTVFIVGFISIAYQILMVRIIILLFGNQIEVFSFVISAFLIATGLSAITSTWHLRHNKNLALFFLITIILSAILISISPMLLAQLPSLNTHWKLSRHGFQMMIWLIILLPQFFIASLLPTAIKISGKRGGRYTYPAGMFYGVNSLGGILAAGVTNQFLLPWLGSHKTLHLFSIILICLALWYIGRYHSRIKQRRLNIIALLAVMLMTINFSIPIQEIYSSVLTNKDESYSQIKLFHEGRAATIAVLDTQNDSRRLFLNGAEEVTSRFYHIQLFKTLGILPVLLHEPDTPKEILVIAFGAGITSGAALNSGENNKVRALDINPDVEKISGLFSTLNNNVIKNPRFTFTNADGRNYIFLNPKKYHIIISDATHPFAYDSWILYTREFYKLIKSRLTNDGIFAQWIPLTITDDFFKIFLKTFASVFPHCTLWNIPGSDQAFILAHPSPFNFNLRKIQDRLDAIPSSVNLSYYQLNNAINLAGFFVLDSAMIKTLDQKEKRINTDNLSYNHRFHATTQSGFQFSIALHSYHSSIAPYVTNATPSQKQKILNLQQRSFMLQRFFYEGNTNLLLKAAAQYPDDKLIKSYLGQVVEEYSLIPKRGN